MTSIREERPGDAPTIAEITSRAFAPMHYASGTEAQIVDRLREAGALWLSLVAVRGSRVVGHVAISPVTPADGAPDWYGLGPVSVEPSFQGQGIGSSLIQESLLRLRGAGARGCVLVGDPAYYGRFGFRSSEKMFYSPDVGDAFQVLLLHGPEAEGRVRFHRAFHEESERGSGS